MSLLESWISACIASCSTDPDNEIIINSEPSLDPQDGWPSQMLSRNYAPRPSRCGTLGFSTHQVITPDQSMFTLSEGIPSAPESMESLLRFSDAETSNFHSAQPLSADLPPD